MAVSFFNLVVDKKKNVIFSGGLEPRAVVSRNICLDFDVVGRVVYVINRVDIQLGVSVFSCEYLVYEPSSRRQLRVPNAQSL